MALFVSLAVTCSFPFSCFCSSQNKKKSQKEAKLALSCKVFSWNQFEKKKISAPALKQPLK
jgi:hypothetical protein